MVGPDHIFNDYNKDHTPISCVRSQWYTLFGFLFAVFGWVPALLADRSQESSKALYKLAYLMFLMSAFSILLGYVHTLTVIENHENSSAYSATDYEVDYTLPIVVLSVVVLSMLFHIGVIGRAADRVGGAVDDAIKKTLEFGGVSYSSVSMA